MSYIVLSNNQLIALAITVLVVLAFLIAIKSQLQNTSSEENLISELAKKIILPWALAMQHQFLALF